MPSKRSKSHPSKKPSADLEHSKTPEPSSHQNPIPNPNPNPDPSKSPKKESKPSDSMSKESDPNSQRKRKAREFDNDDTIAILNRVIKFRSKTGGTPTRTQLKPFLDSLKDSLHSQLTQDQLHNKLRHLRHKFNKMAGAGVGPTPYDRTFYELCTKAWGSEGMIKNKPNGGPERIKEEERILKENGGSERIKEEEMILKENGGSERIKDEEEDDDNEMDELEEGDELDSFKYLNHEAEEYWKLVGLPVESLELGLKSMDKSKAKALENKWRQHLKVDLKLEGKRFDLYKELYAALSAAHRGMNA